jgi:GNAT superfamily N-acetyltransferase
MRSCLVSVEIRQEVVTPRAVSEYARISIAFVVDRVLEVTLADGGLGGVSLAEAPVVQPYLKDYDAVEGEGPERWAERFDVSNWCMLAGRDDVAVLWDIRVVPGQRGTGVGSALFQAAEDWAATRGCKFLTIETQNVNVAACRFYRKMGCTLGAIDRFAYPELPGEVQLLWLDELRTRE